MADFCKNQTDSQESLYMGVFGVAYYEFGINFSKFKMGDQIWLVNFKIGWIRVKLFTRGFLGSLITNLASVVEDLKRQIQYDGRFYQNRYDSLETCYKKTF